MTTGLAVLGGLLGLDQTGVGQFMVSRPLVTGTLVGALLGSPDSGLLVGALLEGLFLPAFPVGGARFPETGPATVVAAATASTPGAGGLALAVVMGVVWALLGSGSVTVLRRVNERLVPDPWRSRVEPGRLVGRHLGAVALDFLRGTALTGIGLVLAGKVAAPLARRWPLAAEETTGLLAMAACVSLGGLLSGLGPARRRARLVAVGALAGMAVGALL
ncbi:MAG: hypothetical protein GWM92_00625 [Gemmatimonadetes bacterium]|nr:PTS sugar transporter subunit IIC [Gemmatimonadota bacterium]NIR80010.1 PTS sugar transporter subunit IIC [Gemmatimonadota bacterium]NIT85478.1 PTS sugar transporter subunit IIC [Gemmatimonadota bacterium]NIU29302.1 PTS sugar transporter subunit IIC [Gemmatimonadota bacterium]NIU34379.1 hypothetical protein [Gemmatimonadota bacterium]